MHRGFNHQNPELPPLENANFNEMMSNDMNLDMVFNMNLEMNMTANPQMNVNTHANMNTYTAPNKTIDMAPNTNFETGVGGNVGLENTNMNTEMRVASVSYAETAGSRNVARSPTVNTSEDFFTSPPPMEATDVAGTNTRTTSSPEATNPDVPQPTSLATME